MKPTVLSARKRLKIQSANYLSTLQHHLYYDRPVRSFLLHGARRKMRILGGRVWWPECAKDRHTRLVFSANKYWFIGLEIERGVICDRGQLGPRAPRARSVPRRAPLGPRCTRDARWGTTVNLRARGWSTGSYIRGCDRELTLRELSHPLPDSHRDYPGRARKKSRDRRDLIHTID